MPLAEDLFKAYENYYTHSARPGVANAGCVRRFYRTAKEYYVRYRFGYPLTGGSFISRLIASLFRCLPTRRGEVDMEMRLLQYRPGGRLLDVGCGSGAWLLEMQKMGWQVEGVDFDQNAVREARRHGLVISSGSLEEQRYPEQSFDAIALNHVIEHVPDPVATLRECFRILRPHGQLALFTPNGSALGRRLMGRHWRGLEPPRHLHIFSSGSMRRMLEEVGFSQMELQTFNSRYIWQFSCRLKNQVETARDGKLGRAARFQSEILLLLEQGWLFLDSDVGECMGARAIKD